jgi:hypothetical protein
MITVIFSAQKPRPGQWIISATEMKPEELTKKGGWKRKKAHISCAPHCWMRGRNSSASSESDFLLA